MQHISYEWTDWHLTPSGWILGNHKINFNDIVYVKPPANRVLTRRYLESIETLNSPLRIFRKNVWAINNPEKIRRLYKLYEFPNALEMNKELPLPLNKNISKVS